MAQYLDELHDESGRVIRLAIEPEPCCVLETTIETIQFFETLRHRAAELDAIDAVKRHVGVCYDVCHQSVEFEDVAESIRALDAADVRIVKVHISSAIESDPNDLAQREALAQFVEKRYLHQTFAKHPSGSVEHVTDLTAEICQSPPDRMANAHTWRTHYHVPVNAESIGPLKTTLPDLKRALGAVRRLPYAPHLEIETYTWNVLPDTPTVDLVEGLAAEVTTTRRLLEEAQKPEPQPTGTVVSLST